MLFNRRKMAEYAKIQKKKHAEAGAAAAPASPAPAPDRAAATSQPERRLDAADGGAYTKEEFVEEYGGTEEWDASTPAA